MKNNMCGTTIAIKKAQIFRCRLIKKSLEMENQNVNIIKYNNRSKFQCRNHFVH